MSVEEQMSQVSSVQQDDPPVGEATAAVPVAPPIGFDAAAAPPPPAFTAPSFGQEQDTTAGAQTFSQGASNTFAQHDTGPQHEESAVQDEGDDVGDEDEDEDDDKPQQGTKGPVKRAGRRKINIEFIEDKSRRHITFSKRKAGIMKKAYELSALTGTQVLLLVASETGHVYTYATEKLQPLIQKPEGKNLIQTCLSAPDTMPAQASISDQPHGSPQPSPMNERPTKQRKMSMPAGGMPPNDMAGYLASQSQSYRNGGPSLPFQGGLPTGGGLPHGLGGVPNISALAAAQARFGLGAGGDRGLPGMPGSGLQSALQGINPAILQGLMNGQLPPPALMGMFAGANASNGSASSERDYMRSEGERDLSRE